MKKLASLDIEISDELSTPGEPGFPPHISCAAIALSDDPDNVIFFSSAPDTEHMIDEEVWKLVHAMSAMVNDGYTFLTWNGVAFDFPVIAENLRGLKGAYSALQDGFPCTSIDTVQKIAWANHIDMMLLVTFQTGYRLSLDAALAGAGLAGKLHNVTLNNGTPITDMGGAKAPELWRAGERKAVLEYLKQDVLQPLELAKWIEGHGEIRWTSKKGKPMYQCVPQLFTVAEAYRCLPEPGDLSWMSAPILREDYIRKYLPFALEGNSTPKA